MVQHKLVLEKRARKKLGKSWGKLERHLTQKTGSISEESLFAIELLHQCKICKGIMFSGNTALVVKNGVRCRSFSKRFCDLSKKMVAHTVLWTSGASAQSSQQKLLTCCAFLQFLHHVLGTCWRLPGGFLECPHNFSGWGLAKLLSQTSLGLYTNVWCVWCVFP